MIPSQAHEARPPQQRAGQNRLRILRFGQNSGREAADTFSGLRAITLAPLPEKRIHGASVGLSGASQIETITPAKEPGGSNGASHG
jgi:hypothetical protein